MQNSPSTNHIEFTIEKLNRIHNKNRIAGKKHPEIEKNDMKKTVEKEDVVITTIVREKPKNKSQKIDREEDADN